MSRLWDSFLASKSHVVSNALAETALHLNPFFFAGLGTFVILYLFPPTQKLFQDVRENFAGCVYNKKLVFIGLGSVILGMGMTLAGAVSIMYSNHWLVKYDMSSSQGVQELVSWEAMPTGRYTTKSYVGALITRTFNSASKFNIVSLPSLSGDPFPIIAPF